MNQSTKLVKNYGLVAGVVAIAAAFMIVVFVLLAEIGCLQPRKITLVVSTDSVIAEYSGKKLVGGYSLEQGSLMDGHSFELISQSSVADVGEFENIVELRVTDLTGADVTNRYDIHYKYGILKLLPKDIAIISEGRQKNYDGTPLKCDKYRISSGELVGGHNLKIKSSAERIFAGEQPNQIDFEVFDASGRNVTEFYNISLQPGTLVVNGIPLYVSTKSASKTYDGEPVSNPDWSLTSGKLEAGDRLVAVSSTSFEGVGTVENVVNLAVKDAAGFDVTGKYNIRYIYGKISVKPVPLSIEMGSVTKKYTGEPVTCNTYSITSGALCKGHKLSVVGKSRTGVGVTYNDVLNYTITATAEDGTKTDVSNCYTLSYTSGIITVSP